MTQCCRRSGADAVLQTQSTGDGGVPEGERGFALSRTRKRLIDDDRLPATSFPFPLRQSGIKVPIEFTGAGPPGLPPPFQSPGHPPKCLAWTIHLVHER
jgi:hypothetical protein